MSTPVPEFTLNPAFFCSVSKIHRQNKYGDRTDLSEEEVLDVLLGNGEIVTRYSIDHPEFTRFREELAAHGYIHIVREYSNGDRVLQPFILNDLLFEKHETFPCASAIELEGKLKSKRWGIR